MGAAGGAGCGAGAAVTVAWALVSEFCFASELCLLSVLVFPSAPCFALVGAAAACLTFGTAAAAGEAIGLGVSSLAGAATDADGSEFGWNRAAMPMTPAIAAKPTIRTSHSLSLAQIRSIMTTSPMSHAHLLRTANLEGSSCEGPRWHQNILDAQHL